METQFTFTKPELIKPESTKKDTRWYVYYTITIAGVKQYRKEYGLKNYGISLTKGSLKEREKKAEDLLEKVNMHLLQNRDPQSIFTDRVKKQVEVKKQAEEIIKAKIDIDAAIEIVANEKGWTGTVAVSKEFSAKNIKRFYQTTFKKYLVKIKKDEDIRKVNKIDIKNFIEEHFNPINGNRGWKKETCKINRGYVSIFFQVFLDKDLMLHNPAKGIKLKNDSEKVVQVEEIDPFELWTEEELEIWWEHTDNEKLYKLHVFSKCIYYSFIRPSEILRLTLEMVDFKNERFVIPAQITKSARRYKAKDTVNIDIPDDLLHTLKKWIKYQFGSKLDHSFYLFPNSKGHTVKHIYDTFQDQYRAQRDILKAAYPGMFNKNIYSLKHNGISRLFHTLVHDPTYTPAQVIHTIQQQARHSSFLQTETYLRDHNLLFKQGRRKVNF